MLQRAALFTVLLAAAVVATIPAPLPSPTGNRKLLGTLTITAKQGDLWAAQYTSSTEKKVSVDNETGKRQTTVTRTSGSALAVNDRRCLKEDCEKPVAQATAYSHPDEPSSRGTSAYARGSKLSTTKTQASSTTRNNKGGESTLHTRGSSDSADGGIAYSNSLAYSGGYGDGTYAVGASDTSGNKQSNSTTWGASTKAEEDKVALAGVIANANGTGDGTETVFANSGGLVYSAGNPGYGAGSYGNAASYGTKNATSQVWANSTDVIKGNSVANATGIATGQSTPNEPGGTAASASAYSDVDESTGAQGNATSSASGLEIAEALTQVNTTDVAENGDTLVVAEAKTGGSAFGGTYGSSQSAAQVDAVANPGSWTGTSNSAASVQGTSVQGTGVSAIIVRLEGSVTDGTGTAPEILLPSLPSPPEWYPSHWVGRTGRTP